MKTTLSSLRRGVAAGLHFSTLLCFAGMAHATTYYWDVNGNGAGSGVTGTQHSWVVANFTTDSTGATGTSSTNTGNTTLPGSGDDVIFSAGTDATIAYTSVAVTDSINSITLNTNSTGSLTLSGTTVTGFTIGSGGVAVKQSTQTSATTSVLQITTGQTAGGITLSAAQSWTNTDTTGGLVDVETPVVINGLWTLTSGYIRLGKAVSDSGSGGVKIAGANVTMSSSSSSLGSNAFGTGAVELSSGSLGYVSASSGAASFANAYTIDGGFTFSGGGGSGVNMTFTNTGTISGSPTVTFNDTSGNAGTTFSNTVTLASNATFAGSGNSTFSGGIAESGGSRSLSYTGSGRLTLSAASTYTGGTSISGTGGTVYANNTTGSATGTGSVSVTGGTLLGTGTIAPGAGKNITIGGSGTLFPGTGANSTGGLTITNASTTQNLLTAAPNATLAFDLNTGGNSSKLTLAGVVGTGTGANAELSFNSGGSGSTNTLISLTDLSGGTLTSGAYNLIVGTSNGQYSGLTLGGTATDGGSIITGGLALANNSFISTYSNSFLELNNGVIEVDVTSVPEPGTWCLLLAGLACLWLLPSVRRAALGVLILE